MCVLFDRLSVVAISHKTQMALELARQMLSSIRVLAVATIEGSIYFAQSFGLCGYENGDYPKAESDQGNVLHTSSIVVKKSVRKS